MNTLSGNQFNEDLWHLSKLDYLTSRDHEKYAAKGEHPKTYHGKEDCPKCNPENWHVWAAGGLKYEDRPDWDKKY